VIYHHIFLLTSYSPAVRGVAKPRGEKMLNDYETVFITIPEISDSHLKNIKSKIESSISKTKGEVVKLDDWGVKKLAYEISSNKKGKYVLYDYKAGADSIKDIERTLKLDENVLRYMTVKKDKPKLTKKEKKQAKNK
jgi:small subunit ribosomal protein S6